MVRTQILVLALLLAAGVLTATLPAQAAATHPASQPPTNEQFWEQVFAGERVLEVHFKLSQANFEAMWPESGMRREGARQGGPPRGGPPQGPSFEYVEADLEVAGQQLARIGLRYKGNSSFRSSAGLKRPFKVDTDKFVKNQRLFGRTKLNFSNAFKDPTYLREKLGYEVFAAAGLPTPGVGWAQIYITVPGVRDRELIGFYTVIEQVDDEFLVRNYGKASKKSVLMKPDGLSEWSHLGSDPANYIERYAVKEGETQAALLERFAAFCQLVHEGSDSDFAAQIGDYLDTESMAAYLAANCLLGNLDSWVAGPHNYYLVVDAADQRVKILPWDLNECFGAFTMGTSQHELQTWSIQRPWVADRRVLERLFESAAFRGAYEQKVRELMAGSFAPEKLEARIATLQQLVAEHLDGRERAALVRGIEGAGEAAAAPERERGRDGNRRGGAGRGGSGPALLPFLRMRTESVRRQLAGEEAGSVLKGRNRRFAPPGGRRR